MVHSERQEEHAAHSCAMENIVARISDGQNQRKGMSPSNTFPWGRATENLLKEDQNSHSFLPPHT